MVGVLGWACFSDGDHPKWIWGFPAGVSRHKQNCLAFFCCVEIAFLGGVTSEGAPSSGAVFPSCLLNMVQAGGPGSEPLCPGNGQACAHNGPLLIPSPALCLRSRL